jgi:hypothetical protein
MLHGTPHIEMDLDLAEKIAVKKGAKNFAEQAANLGLHPSVWSRLRGGRSSATQDVIAKVLTTCQDLRFYDIFRVVP